MSTWLLSPSSREGLWMVPPSVLRQGDKQEKQKAPSKLLYVCKKHTFIQLSN